MANVPMIIHGQRRETGYGLSSRMLKRVVWDESHANRISESAGKELELQSGCGFRQALFARTAPIIFEVGRAGPSGLLLEEAHQVARIREAVRIGQLADAAPLEE